MAIVNTATPIGGATGVGLYTTSGTFTVSPLVNTVPGRTLLLGIAQDPTDPLAGQSEYTAVRDTKGNNWQPVSRQVFSAAPGSGATIALFYCVVQRAILTTDSIVIFSPFAGTTTRIAIVMDEFSGVSAVHNNVFSDFAAPVAGAGATTTQSPGNITMTAAGQMVYGVGGIETNTAITGDADTTNGSWSALASQLSNSGSDLTSMTLTRQFKIVTAAGIQNWATTTAAAKNWVATAALLAPAPAVVPPAFPQGNPHYPALAGFEGLPTSTAELTVDTGTGYIYNYATLPSELGSSFQVVGAEFNTPSELCQHHVAYDWYNTSGLVDASADDIQTVYLPLRRASVPFPSNATTSSLAPAPSDAAVLAALSNVGGDFMVMPGIAGSSTINLWFDPTALIANYSNSRIVNFGIQYIAYKDAGAPQRPGQGMSVVVSDSLAGGGAGAQYTLAYWLTNYYRRDNKYETRWFGETNLSPRTNTVTNGSPGFQHIQNMNAPWRVADLAHMASGDESLKFTVGGQPGQVPPDDILQNVCYLDYIVMVVQLAPERRIGAGIRTVGNSYVNAGSYPFIFDWTRFQNPFRTDLLAAAGLGTNTYSIVVREALPASESDYLRIQTTGSATTSLFEAVGPSLQLKAFTQPRESLYPQPDTAVVPIVNGAPYGPVQNFTEYTSSIMVFDENGLFLDGPSFGGYNGLAPNSFIQVYGSNSPLGAIKTPGAVQYSKLKVLIKPDPATQLQLNFSIQQPFGTPIATASITVAQWNALPLANAAGFGWKEANLTLSAPITPTAGNVWVVASSSTDAGTPWYWAAANPDNGDGLNGYAGVLGFDYAAVLTTTLPSPAVTMGTFSSTVFRASGRCLSTPEKLAQITVTNGASFDRIVILRHDTQGQSIFVGQIDSPTNGTVFVDYATPWDITQNTLAYQVIGERFATKEATMTQGLWNDINIMNDAAFALAYNPNYTGAGVPQGTYAGFDLIYVPANTGKVTMEWKSLNSSTQVQLHGIDKQVQLRASEQRGLTLTTTILIDHLVASNCDNASASYNNLNLFGNPKETVLQGNNGMSPLPFGGDNAIAQGGQTFATLLRDLERIGRPITIKLPGGHTRLMNIEIGGMVTTPSAGLYMADITLTDAAPMDYLCAIDDFT